VSDRWKRRAGASGGDPPGAIRFRSRAVPFRLALLAYPAMVVAYQLAKPNAVAEYEQAKAFTPERARFPEDLKVPRRAVRKAVQKHLLIPVPGGRYYINQEAVRRRDTRNMVSMIVALLAFVPVVWLLW